jgi:hypothetical protein
MEDYIPLYTDEFAIAFCQATESLCPDVQRLIWHKVLYAPVSNPPPPPKKCPHYSRTCSISLPKDLFESKTMM